MMRPDQLLGEFPPVSTEEWEAVIAADLKGALYDDALVWRAPEGVAIRPYYRAEDLAGLDWVDAVPGEFPFARGSGAEAGWRIREEVAVADPAEANRRAQAAVAAGAEEIGFRGVDLATDSDPVLLLTNLADIPVCFASGDSQSVALLLEYLDKNPRNATIAAGMDPFSDVESAARLIGAAPPAFVPFTLDATRVAPQDTDAIEAAGWMLAAGADLLSALEERGIEIDRAAQTVEFEFRLGTNYFYEIARLRAFRMLWARVVESFGGSRSCARARIAARTHYQATIADASHWHVLRATTEAMAAILGGANSICVTSYEQSEAACRLARNTQLLLRHEGFLARVADPAGGSYYLEHLTGDIAERAWQTLQAVEARGGWRKGRA